MCGRNHLMFCSCEIDEKLNFPTPYYLESTEKISMPIWYNLFAVMVSNKNLMLITAVQRGAKN